MTAPERIWWNPSGHWSIHDDSEMRSDPSVEYIRADLARPTLADALALPEVKAPAETAKVIATRNKFANPVRSADVHKGNCQCARCHYDALDAALAALTTAPVDASKTTIL